MFRVNIVLSVKGKGPLETAYITPSPWSDIVYSYMD